MIKSEQINELAAALTKAQAELESAKKDSRGHGYNYSDLATVIDSAKSVLPKHNLSYSQLVGSAPEGYASVTTILMHSSGQFIGSEAVIKVPDMRGVNDTQKFGACLSYGRRYGLQAILGMASEDNDASDKVAPQASKSETTSTAQEEAKPAPAAAANRGLSFRNRAANTNTQQGHSI